VGEEACISTALLSPLASAPSTRPRRVCPYVNEINQRKAYRYRHVHTPGVTQRMALNRFRTFRRCQIMVLIPLLRPFITKAHRHRSVVWQADRALTCNTKTALYFFASSFTTSFICLHGSAHRAQKLMSETRSRSALRRSWKCSVEVTSTRFVGADMMEGTEGQVDRVTKSRSTQYHAILRYLISAINGI